MRKVIPILLFIVLLGAWGAQAREKEDCTMRSLAVRNIEQRCELVKSSCGDEVHGLLNYLYFTYCDMGKAPAVAVFLMIVEVVFLFWFINVATDLYFTPVMEYFTEVLGLSNNVAGVTLLALGNQANDMFTSVSAFKNGSAALALGSLLGSAFFVSALIVGAVAFIAPFKLSTAPFMRDTLFLVLAVTVTILVMRHHVITLWEAIMYMGLYGIYVAVVILSAWLGARRKAKKAKNALTEPLVDGSINQTPKEIVAPDIQVIMEEDEGDEEMANDVEAPSGGLTAPDPEKYRSRRKSVHEAVEHHVVDIAQKHYWMQVLETLDGEEDEWEERSRLGKIFYCIVSPVLLLCRISIPVVEWDWRLALFQATFAPFFIVFGAGAMGVKLGGVFPLWTLALIIGVICSVLVYLFAKRDAEPPKWHGFFVFVGLISAMMWINLIANELVFLLEVLGDVMQIHQGTMGLTVLAWGNSVNDLAANMAMARAGNPKMAVAACHGGPVMNLFVGTALATFFVYASARKIPGVLVDLEFNVFVCSCFLVVTLVVSQMWLLSNKMKSTKGMAIVLIVLYVLYMAVAFTFEWSTFDDKWRAP